MRHVTECPRDGVEVFEEEQHIGVLVEGGKGAVKSVVVVRGGGGGGSGGALCHGGSSGAPTIWKRRFRKDGPRNVLIGDFLEGNEE
jgi:hypothetical protein